MSDEMREVTDLGDLAAAYPNVRKVTLDAANKTAYVFNGRSNRAVTVTGDEYDALVKLLPADAEPAGGTKTPRRGKGEKAAE